MCAGEKGSYNWQVSGVWFCAVLRPSSPGEGPGHAAHHQREKSGHQTPKEGKLLMLLVYVMYTMYMCNVGMR